MDYIQYHSLQETEEELKISGKGARKKFHAPFSFVFYGVLKVFFFNDFNFSSGSIKYKV